MTSRSQVLLLVGVPGSGKTFFAETLAATYTGTCIIAGGSREDRLVSMDVALRKDRPFVIVDACNLTTKQRKDWITLARLYAVPRLDIIFCSTEPAVCLDRRPEAKADIEYALERLIPPTTREGVDAVYSPEDWCAHNHVSRTMPTNVCPGLDSQ